MRHYDDDDDHIILDQPDRWKEKHYSSSKVFTKHLLACSYFSAHTHTIDSLAKIIIITIVCV